MKRVVVARISGGTLVREPHGDPQREQENIAGIVENRQVPGTKGTDRAYMQGRMHDQFSGWPDWMAKECLGDARQAGIDTTGKVYAGWLADSRGYQDPAAWVSGLDDVRSVVRQRGEKNRRKAEQPDVPLADDLLAESVQEIVAANPKRKRDLLGVREEVIAKHAPKAKK